MSKLAKHIERAGLRQVDVAKAMGVSQPVVHYWCTGEKRPSPERIPALAKLLNVEPIRLFTELYPPKNRR